MQFLYEAIAKCTTGEGVCFFSDRPRAFHSSYATKDYRRSQCTALPGLAGQGGIIVAESARSSRVPGFIVAHFLRRTWLQKLAAQRNPAPLLHQVVLRYREAMETSRLPRFRRVPKPAPMLLTPRDRNIIQLVHRHRFLRSSQLTALIADSSQQVLRRLQLLYHNGFLERPRAQLDYYHQGGSHHMVYGIGNKGATLLNRELGVPLRHLRWSEKNRSVGRIYLEHALLVSDVMVALEIACRAHGRVRLIPPDQLPLSTEGSQEPQSISWKVNVTGSLKLGVIPDRVFALEYENPDGQSDRAFFFLEADRGTMPVMRQNLSQTSFYRKLVAYEATWSQSVHRTRFGFHRFRVLTVTTSNVRLRSLVEACSKLRTGHGLFLFADGTILEKPDDILAPLWQTARQGEPASLLA